MDGCGCTHRALFRRVTFLFIFILTPTCEVNSRLSWGTAAAGHSIKADFSHSNLFKCHPAAFFFEPISYKYGNTRARSCLPHTEEKWFISYVAALPVRKLITLFLGVSVKACRDLLVYLNPAGYCVVVWIMLQTAAITGEMGF